jgi:hypothetical protein
VGALAHFLAWRVVISNVKLGKSPRHERVTRARMPLSSNDASAALAARSDGIDRASRRDLSFEETTQTLDISSGRLLPLLERAARHGLVRLHIGHVLIGVRRRDANGINGAFLTDRCDEPGLARYEPLIGKARIDARHAWVARSRFLLQGT